MDNLINVSSEGLLFGYGAFETILVKDNIAIDFNSHYNRLKTAMDILDMEFSISKETLLKEAFSHVKNSKLSVLKISCHKDKSKTRIVYSTRDFPYSKEIYDRGYKLKLSNIKRHSENPIYKIKSTNFINNQIEISEIKKLGFNEAIHLNENDLLTECIYSNIFFVKNNVLFTPHANTGLLNGIQRQNIIALAKKIGIIIKIGYYNIEDLRNADEIFLTSSLLGIMKVYEFDKKLYTKNVVINKLNEEIMNGLL